MKVVSSAGEMQSISLQARLNLRRIGFVPTMGFLHEGHMALVRKAREVADFVVVSSFVNPAQFDPKEDFSTYPRDNERDDMLCAGNGVDIVFRPSVGDIYPEGHTVFVDEQNLSSALCGKFRPGHFKGVLTVVAKLFNIVQPDIAVFGQKDAQQARVIEQMICDMKFPIRLIVSETVREPDGLAMSSRNAYLSADERKRAVAIYGSLKMAEDLHRRGLSDVEILTNKVRELIERDAQPIAIEYVEAVDYTTLKPVKTISGKVLLAVAVRIGNTRLIDNVLL